MKRSRLTGNMKYCTFSGSASRDGGAADSAAKHKRGELQGWKCMPYIVGNETFEKVASTGLTSNFTIYLTSHFHLSQVAAAQYCNVFGGASNFAPLLGAFVSDAYWGRFRTLAWASVVSLLGMVLLTMTAFVPQLKPPSCSPGERELGSCPGASKAQIGVLILSLVFLSVGGGGVRPCSLPFGVDQFDRTTEQGRLGLTSFFNWYYFISTIGSLISLTVVVYIQDNVSWALGYGIPACLMLVSIIFLFMGMRLYEYVIPEGSVFSDIAKVFVAAFRKRSLQLPATDDVLEHESLLYNVFTRSERVTKLPLTLQFRWLNKAAIKCEGDIKEDGTIAMSWRLCTVQQIEEVKCLVRIIPVWASSVVCFLALTQQWTFVVFQSLTMDRHIGSRFQIPAASVGTINLLGLTLFIPVYDRAIVPVLRRFTGHEGGITLLQRQGIGIIIMALSMIIAGQVELKRRNSAMAHGGVTPMSALWLAPQLVLMGIGESFSAVGQIEFYNRQFPEHMHTLAGAMFHCSLGGSNFLSSILVAVVQKNTNWLSYDINTGRVDYLFYVIAAMVGVNFFYFLVCAHFYRCKGAPQHKYGSSEETEKLIC